MNKEELVKKIDVFLSDLIPTPAPVAEVKDEVKLVQSTLEDGVKVEYEVLEVDALVNVKAEDGTLTPLPTNEYVIEGIIVKVEDGIIKEVVESTPEETPETAPEEQAQELSKEEQVKLEQEKFDNKVAEKQLVLQADFETKLAKEKDNFKTQLEELSKEIKLSNIIQAPVEKVTKKVIYTVKDKMMMDIERNNKQE